MTGRRTLNVSRTRLSSSYTRSLSADQATWLAARLDHLQCVDPKRGYPLHMRMMGLLSAVSRGAVKNRRWGLSLLRRRQWLTRQRGTSPLISPNQRRAIMRLLQMPNTERT